MKFLDQVLLLVLCVLGVRGLDSCEYRNRSSSRLQVKCAHRITLQDMKLLCERYNTSSIHLIFEEVGGSRLHFASADNAVSRHDLHCIHAVRVVVASIQEAILEVQFPKLQRLIIRYTALRKFPEIRNGQPELTHMNLSHNEMRTLNLSSETKQTLSNLQVLDLSYNELTELPSGAFGFFYNLRSLSITNNNVHAVQPGFLRSLFNLDYINLRMNNITRLDSGSLKVSRVKKIYNINLSQNPIEVIKSDAMVFIRNMSLVLDSSVMRCDCRAQTLVYAAQASRGVSARCGYPASLRNQRITDVNQANLLCTVNVKFFQETEVMQRTMEGANVTLDCPFKLLDGPPDSGSVTVAWLRDNQEIGGSSRNVEPHERVSGRRKRMASLWDFIIGGPRGVPELDVRLSASIVVNASVRDAYISKLTIVDTAVDDSNTYKCRVSQGSSHQSSRHINLQVNAPAQITFLSSSRSTVLHRSTTFVCRVRARPLAAIIWSFLPADGRLAASATLLQSSTTIVNKQSVLYQSDIAQVSTLTLLNVSSGYAGTYTCIVGNVGGRSQQSVNLTVDAPPSGVKVVAATVKMDGVDTMMVLCETSGTPPFNFMWHAAQSKEQVLQWEAMDTAKVMSGDTRSMLYYANSDTAARSLVFKCGVSNSLGHSSAVYSPRRGKPEPNATVTTTAKDETIPTTRTTSQRITKEPGAQATDPPQPAQTSDFFQVPFYTMLGIAVLILFVLIVSLASMTLKKSAGATTAKKSTEPSQPASEEK